MAQIILDNASVDFPVYNVASRSLKNHVIDMVTGGSIANRGDGVTIVRGLDGVSAVINEGDRVGLIGHNGCGKTTLLRVISGIFVPSSGIAKVQGECVSLINISLGIDPESTGRENIFLRTAMMGMSRSEQKKFYPEIAEFSGLGDFLDMPYRTYSSGMQMRLAFSTSTAIKPEILIMDEWLSTGDADFAVRAAARLNSVVDNTKILVIASHSKQLLLQVCNRIIWLEHGKIVRDGDAKSVAAEYFG